MARSYHTTRRHLHEARRFNQSDAERRAAGIERLKQQLQIKRRSKRQVRSERRDQPIPAVTPIEVIPITTACHAPFVHFPASAEDLRAVLSALPRGTADDLRQIVMSLGDRWLPYEEMEECNEQPEVDPFVGRRGYEILPGVFAPLVLGQYLPARKRIQIAGYVFSPGLADRSMWEFYLRLHMLMTFVHEVAHHWDFTCRIARGRWRGDDVEKGEIYAEKVQHQWIALHVLPYVERAYPEDLAHLRMWMKERIGIEVPLALLAGDLRATAKKGCIFVNAVFFNTASAFQEFASAAIRGEDATKTRLQFARNLHYSEHYDLANAIIDAVLACDCHNVEALTLEGDILEHEERHGQALQMAMQALAIDGEYIKAMEVAGDAYIGLARWPELAAIAEKLLQKSVWRPDIARAWEFRARARLELGDRQGALEDIERLAKVSPARRRKAERLRDRLNEKMNQ